jgi:16S rRNA (uracil1498-N3)-methyltransferase
MQRRRFYASPEDIDDDRVVLSADESHHLLRVLRLNHGDEVFVFTGLGEEYRCRFVNVEQKRATLEIVEALSDEVESPLQLTLAQALVKGEKFDFIVQKATELGVSRIVPIASEHADLKLNHEHAWKRIERWERISLEAVKQCGRRRRVEINQPQTLNEFLGVQRNAREGVSPDSTQPPGEDSNGRASQTAFIFFNERGGSSIRKALESFADKRAIAVLVGPEGGWSDAEIDAMSNCGWQAVTLGKRILRAETAALVAVTLLEHLAGDLSND